MVSPTLPSVHPWVTMVPTSSAAAVEVWSLISFISSRGLVRMRDLRKLRWGKERGPAGSFSSPDQLGARWSDKNIGKTQDVTRRHKTSQDVTRPSQNCNANRHSLLHFNHTNITCPNVCPSVVNPRSPTETVFMCMCRSLQCGTLFQNVWSNPTFLLSVVFVQGHKLPNDKFRKKCHDMIWYPTIDIDLKSECLWTCSCRCHYIIDFFYLLYLNGVLSIFCSPNIFTGCDVSYFRKFRQHIQNTFKHIKDTLKNTTHINTHVV
jgi:hypothetical protein